MEIRPFGDSVVYEDVHTGAFRDYTNAHKEESDTTLFYTTQKTFKLRISASYLVILKYAARIIAI